MEARSVPVHSFEMLERVHVVYVVDAGAVLGGQTSVSFSWSSGKPELSRRIVSVLRYDMISQPRPPRFSPLPVVRIGSSHATIPARFTIPSNKPLTMDEFLRYLEKERERQHDRVHQEIDELHEWWLTFSRDKFQKQLQSLANHQCMSIDGQILMLLTLEPMLFDLLRQALHALLPGSMNQLFFSFLPPDNGDDRYCRDPPSDEELEATMLHVAQIVGSFDVWTNIELDCACPSCTQILLTGCTRLQSLKLESCEMTEDAMRAMCSITSLKEVTMIFTRFETSESCEAFCNGMESSALEVLTMDQISFPREYQQQVATALARCNTLVQLDVTTGALFDHYCVALSNNFDTKLERLNLCDSPHRASRRLDLRGEHVDTVGIEAALVRKISNLLKWNNQRKTCPPLFASIGNAETDAERKQCLVDAFEAVDIPVVFEYITANQNNMIELIQRLGRSRKRQRED